MMGRAPRPEWTDSDYAFLADHPDWTARRVGDAIGRTKTAVVKVRRRLAAGWERTQAMDWSADEDDVLLGASPHMTAEYLAALLPGRTAFAIQGRRQYLGVRGAHGAQKSPLHIGARPLIAKTCTDCGRLLQADWFAWNTTSRIWSSYCRKCGSDRGAARRARHPEQTIVRHDGPRNNRLQELTLLHADRHRELYVDRDFRVLADPDLSILQKALRLGRTYHATRVACKKAGYESHVGLGDPDHDVWVIDNPNEPGQAS